MIQRGPMRRARKPEYMRSNRPWRIAPVSKLLSALTPALLAVTLCVGAKEAPEVGDDPAAERHMMVLAKELRCVQCQNQTLADSEAPLAVDMRQKMRELIAQGKSDEEVRQWLVDRYGDFVLFRPPVKGNTVLLWFGPGLLLIVGLSALYITLKRRIARLDAQAAANPQWSAADAKRAQELLADESEQGSLS
jgi:cytochrome c-type biogenesis protein CcmH